MEQLDLLRHVLSVLERLNVPYMLVGSYGSSVFGEPRFTHDIDIVLELKQGQVTAFCAAFTSPEFYLAEQSVREAVSKRFQFNLLHPSSGNKVDFMFSRDDEWGRTQLGRRTRITLEGGLGAFAASPEDVIVGKLWYYAEGGSEKHLRDIASILKVRGDSLDRAEIGRWADKLGYTAIWQMILARLVGTPGSEGAVDGSS